MAPKNKEGTAMISGFDDVFEDSTVYWPFNRAMMVDSALRDIPSALRAPGRSVSTKVRTHLKSRLNLRGSKAKPRLLNSSLCSLWRSSR